MMNKHVSNIDKKKLVCFFLGLIALVTLMLPDAASASDDHSNSMIDATLVSENETIQGALNPVGDHDYFKFTASQTGTYTIKGSGINIRYYLVNESGTELAVSKGEADINTSIKLTFKLTSGETYYLKVQHPFDIGIGFYYIQILPFVAVDLYTDYTNSYSLSLYWASVEGFSRYNVYRAVSKTGPYTKLNDLPLVSWNSYNHFNDYSLTADTT